MAPAVGGRGTRSVHVEDAERVVRRGAREHTS
jgi:hypothetical protein